MSIEARNRTIVTRVLPQIEEGRFAIKKIKGDEIVVTAEIFADSHFQVCGQLLFCSQEENKWHEIPCKPLGNDRWEGRFTVNNLGLYFYTIQGWIDYFHSWQKDIQKKIQSNIDISQDILCGLNLIKNALTEETDEKLNTYYLNLQATKNPEELLSFASDSNLRQLMRDKKSNKRWITEYPKRLPIRVDLPLAGFSSWYEIFPRSCSSQPGQHGTFHDFEKRLYEISKMGFDLVYLPPIHPIGISKKERTKQSFKWAR